MFIRSCPECLKDTPPAVQPLVQTPLPSHPWEKVAADLFVFKQTTYLIVADYYSRYVEVKKLASTTSTSVVTALHAIFSIHGIPSTFMSDNGPQFDSGEIREFAKSYNFTHVTSSPHYPQSNGLAERMVRTVKGLLRYSQDPYMALLNYRSTPLSWCGLSPSELLMGRRVRTSVPQVKKHFIPQWPYLNEFRKSDEKYKKKQKQCYDRWHRVRPLPPYVDDLPVWVQTSGRQIPGQVNQPANTPRSYWVNTSSGQVRRNHRDLRPRVDNSSSTTESDNTTNTSTGVMTRSRSGVILQPLID